MPTVVFSLSCSNLLKLILCYVASNFLFVAAVNAQKSSLRQWGVPIGEIPTGKYNAITDVADVTVGQVTLMQGDSIRTGVTAILPHKGNIFQQKVPAAIYIGNGFGKLTGYSQVEELGNIETPIILTNTLSVPTAADALIDYTLSFPENQEVRSVNPIVGETNDGYLNDIRGRHVTKSDVLKAIKEAKPGDVKEGNVGAGTGTVCFGYKGGIGTASRLLPSKMGGYTIGVLVQTNFGGFLQIAGVPVGIELNPELKNRFRSEDADGSCMIVIATDAPLDARNLKRLAKRAWLGLGKTGGIASNGSGEYVIAFSAAKELRIPHASDTLVQEGKTLSNDAITPLFMAAIEATEEAILNALFQAETMTGRNGHTVEALPLDKVKDLLKKYGKLQE